MRDLQELPLFHTRPGGNGIYGVLSVVACTLVCETGSTRSILVGHPKQFNAQVAQLVEATVLEAVKCGFESLLGHQRLYMEKIKTLNTLVGPVKTFEELIGRSLCRVTADEEELILYLSDTNYVKFFHYQDCCEGVYIEDICGDLEDLVGSPILVAEEVSNYEAGPKYEGEESYTWTFYRFATQKGWVNVRWYGSSNGYYSEGVSVEVVDLNEKED